MCVRTSSLVSWSHKLYSSNKLAACLPWTTANQISADLACPRPSSPPQTGRDHGYLLDDYLLNDPLLFDDDT